MVAWWLGGLVRCWLLITKGCCVVPGDWASLAGARGGLCDEGPVHDEGLARARDEKASTLRSLSTQ